MGCLAHTRIQHVEVRWGHLSTPSLQQRWFQGTSQDSLNLPGASLLEWSLRNLLTLKVSISF